MSALSNCRNIEDVRRLARARVPNAVFDYADGAANDEYAKNNNINAYRRYQLIPKVLNDVSDIDLSTEIMGTPLDTPLILAPTAINHFFHSCGELGVARCAEQLGTVFTLSSIGSETIENVAKVASRLWYQLYVFKDRGITYDFIDRCKACHYQALILTVDTPVGGKRERDLLHGMTIPPKLNLTTILEAALHPNWWLPYLFGKPLEFANVTTARAKLASKSTISEKVKSKAAFSNMMSYMNAQFDPSVSWDDAEQLIKRWGGHFAVKGIMNSEDAKRAVDIGATCIIVSNHGGRQLDDAPAPLDVVPEIVQAVAGKAQIICDGGIRRGSDLLKAIALGANACMTGRPYIYGLCAGGEPGVQHTLSLLHNEIVLAMQLTGCRSLEQLSKTMLRRTHS